MLSTMETYRSGGFPKSMGFTYSNLLLTRIYLSPGLDAAGLTIEGLALGLGDDPMAASQTT